MITTAEMKSDEYILEDGYRLYPKILLTVAQKNKYLIWEYEPDSDSKNLKRTDSDHKTRPHSATGRLVYKNLDTVWNHTWPG